MRTSWWTGSPAASPSPAEARREAGFTLLEVLVAFAIMAVAMTALLQAFGGGLVAARRTDAASQSLAAARSLLERVGSELPIESGTRTGGNAEFQWQISVARRKSPLDQIKEPEPRYALFDVVVTVTATGAAPVSLATVRMAAVQ
jgi:general secretion pathway protein I